MTLEDPFFLVKEDVVKAIIRTQGLYQRWSDLTGDLSSLVTKEELEWISNELRSSLRSIEWDLEDLEETIAIVEKNPKKFKIENGEIHNRKSFVDQTRGNINSIKEKMSFTKPQREKDHSNRIMSRGSNILGQQGGYVRLHNDIESPSHQFIENNVQQQQMIIQSQDDQLEKMTSSVGTLKNMSKQIGNELDEQAIMLDDFSHEMETTESRLDGAMKKVAKVLHMSNDRRQWIAIGVLSAILVLVVILLLVL